VSGREVAANLHNVGPRSSPKSRPDATAVYKLDSEPLDQFIQRKGGINACADRFSRAMGQVEV
jgi:hypothetical protein